MEYIFIFVVSIISLSVGRWFARNAVRKILGDLTSANENVRDKENKWYDGYSVALIDVKKAMHGHG